MKTVTPSWDLTHQPQAKKSINIYTYDEDGQLVAKSLKTAKKSDKMFIKGSFSNYKPVPMTWNASTMQWEYVTYVGPGPVAYDFV